MKNKKKMISLVASLALIGAIGAGATLAYFSASSEKSNKVKMGQVKIDLTEVSEDGTPDNNGGYVYENVMPGDILDKQVYVQVPADAMNAYVLVRVDYVSEELSVDALSLLTFDATEDWTCVYDEGTTKAYMYQYVEATDDAATAGFLVPGADKTQVFEKVLVPGAEWTNDEAGKAFSIDVKAFAIQEANLDAETALGLLLVDAGLENIPQ